MTIEVGAPERSAIDLDSRQRTPSRPTRVPILHARPWLRFAPAVVVIVLMRVRFVFTPITSDEGGFLAIARAWDRGAVLYDDVWVDRPQGLIVLYRVWERIGLGTPEGVRVLGIVACVVGAIACGRIAEELFDRRAGVAASLAVGALASVPQYEGFIANGELLSGAVGALALAIAIAACWNRAHPALWALFAAGVVAGVAFSLKQSGFDAFVCACCAVAIRVLGRRWTGRERLLALPVLVAGFAVPVLAMIVHGAITGWDRFWYAVYGYNASQRSGLKDADWDKFWDTFALARPALLPAVAILVVAGVFALARHRPGAVLVCVSWLAAATVAFVLGGQFHRHYWIILAFPLGTFAGGALAMVPTRVARAIGVAVLVAAPLVMTVSAVTIPRHDVPRRLSGDVRSGEVRSIKDEHIAAWFEDHARAGDAIYARCASAGLYGNLTVDPPFPYLWHDGVTKVPGAIDRLGEMLESPDRPRFVALYQGAASCDREGRQEEALALHYRQVATIDGIPILERRDETPPAPVPRG